jgi:predicted NBD/HSP70 family sugar kinase
MVVAPLDPAFQPAMLANRRYRQGAEVPLVIGLEREDNLLSRYETVVRGDESEETFQYVERLVKFLLWARGGWRILFGGSPALGMRLRERYFASGERAFDREIMSRVYEKSFELIVLAAEDVPAARGAGATLGGHLDGCRIGFDLGASDYKIAAVNEGTVVYSDEFPWNPKDQPDPQYHYDHINGALKKAAARLPKVDAIGGSTAGIVVDNKIMIASPFRGVPAANFDAAKNIFLRLRDEWRLPLEVANDGDVTALAGAMSLKANGLLGIAMGSSEAAGYLDPKGRMTGWLNELAFAPVDYNPQAATDEWSGDRGVGALYFSQQAVNKLLPAAGIELPGGMGLPERLKQVQALMAEGDRRAAALYETIGVYLGYAIPHYAEFYDFEHVLVLGRVMTGAGGNLLLTKAAEVLRREFPELAERVRLHLPDEKSRRVGQAVAAASLPAIPRQG